MKSKTKKTTKKDSVKELTVKCLKNCYFGGDFYRLDETYVMDKDLAVMASKTNKFNLV